MTTRAEVYHMRSETLLAIASSFRGTMIDARDVETTGDMLKAIMELQLEDWFRFSPNESSFASREQVLSDVRQSTFYDLQGALAEMGFCRRPGATYYVAIGVLWEEAIDRVYPEYVKEKGKPLTDWRKTGF